MKKSVFWGNILQRKVNGRVLDTFKNMNLPNGPKTNFTDSYPGRMLRKPWKNILERFEYKIYAYICSWFTEFRVTKCYLFSFILRLFIITWYFSHFYNKVRHTFSNIHRFLTQISTTKKNHNFYFTYITLFRNHCFD